VKRVEEIAQAVQELNRGELWTFRHWFLQFDSTAWDEQLEADIAVGRLDNLGEEALADFRAGRTRPL
jgi:hypothetical protein